MKIHRLITTSVTTAALAAAAVLGTVSSASADDYPYARKLCNFIYNGQCVQWATTTTSCFKIFESNASATKKQACSIYAATGRVLVIY